MGKKAPKAPDPYKTADAQFQLNQRTAQEQARMAMTGQDTPTGTLRYVTDPNSPSGYRAVTELSPAEQQLLTQSQGIQGQYGDVFGNALTAVGNTVGQPFDLNAARGNEIADIQRTFLDPQWQQRDQALQTELMNRGIRPGSEQYDIATRQQGQQRDDAYNKMFLDAYNTANQSALTERNMPLTDMGALLGFPQGATNPTFQNTPTPGVAPVDLTSLVNQQYQGELSKYNAGMGGLFGLGSAALGGWAMKGFPGLAAAFSDPRVKTNVTKVGDDPRGWGVYRFRYIWDGIRELGWKLGFMADEVARIRPDAVSVHEPSGLLMVDYDALAEA